MGERPDMWSWRTSLRLVLHGWRPGRNVWSRIKYPASLTPFPEAVRVLSQFGMLRFGYTRGDLIVRLDPQRCDGFTEQILAFQSHLGRLVFPLGDMVIQDVWRLLIDESGIIYAISEFPENRALTIWIFEFEVFAPSFEWAILKMIAPQGATSLRSQSVLKEIGLLGRVYLLTESRRDGRIDRRFAQEDRECVSPW